MKPSKTKKAADTFGVLGYLSTILVWLWAGVLILPWLLKLGPVKDIITPTQTSHPIEPLRVSYENPPEWVVFAVITVAFLIVLAGIWAALKTPKRYVQSASKATHHTASSLVTHVGRNKKLPEKRRVFLTEQIVFIIKFSSLLLGLAIICAAAAWIPMPLPSGITVIVGAYLGFWPLLWFGLQFVCTRIIEAKNPASQTL